MSPARVSLIVVAFLQAAACAALAFIAPWEAGNSGSMVPFGVMIAQAVLAALVFSIHAVSSVLRASLSVGLLGATFLAAFIHYGRHDPSDEMLLLAMLGICLMTAWLQAMFALRMLTWWLNLQLSPGEHRSVLTTTAQFSLWHLLIAMTVIAGLLGGGRIAIPAQPRGGELLVYLEVGTIVLFLIVVTTSSVCAAGSALLSMLAFRRPALWMLLAVIVTLCLVPLEVFLSSLFYYSEIEPIDSLIRNFSAFSWLTLSVLVLRIGGWRLGTPLLLKAT